MKHQTRQPSAVSRQPSAVSRQNSSRLATFVKPLTLAVGLTLGASAWAGVDKWTMFGALVEERSHISATTLPILLNPNQPDTFYVYLAYNNSWEHLGLYKSPNGGGSWNMLPDIPYFGEAVTQIIFAGSDTLYIKASESSSSLYIDEDTTKTWIFKSTNSGMNWSLQSEPVGLYAMTIHPQDSNTLYAYSGQHKSPVKSIDGGITWNVMGNALLDEFGISHYDNGLPAQSIFVDPVNPKIIYSITSSKGDRALRRSDDAGNSWKIISLPTTARKVGFAIHPKSSSIYLNIAGKIFKSTNKGDSWEARTSSAEGDLRISNDGVLYTFSRSAGSAGLTLFASPVFYVSIDDGVTWARRTVPNGTWNEPGQTWDIPGHVWNIMPHPTTVGVMYAAIAKLDYGDSSSGSSYDKWAVAKSNDYGATWEYVRKLKLPSGRGVDSAVKNDPFNANIQYRSESGTLYKSTDGGGNWQFSSTLPAGDYSVSQTEPNTLYSMDASKGIYRSNDAGAHWTQIVTTSTYSYKRGNAGSFVDWGSLRYYLLDGTCVDSFFGSCLEWANIQAVTSNDGGQTWENIGGFNDVLPGTQIKYSEINNLDGSGAIRYAATQKGIYHSSDSGTTWAQFNNAGLPFAEMSVREVRIDPNNSSVLYAYTVAGTFVFGKNSPPSVNSVEAQGSVVTGKQVKLAVYGNYLDVNPLTLNLQDCANPTVLPGGDDMTQYFQCQLGAASHPATGQIKDSSGNVLHDFTVPIPPVISSISPLVVAPGELTTFTVTGSGLLADMSFMLDNCSNIKALPSDSTTSRQFECTVSATLQGNMSGHLKFVDANIYDFTVALGVPSVSGVSPSQVVMGTTTVFSVKGKYLPLYTVFQLGFCSGVQHVMTGASSSERKFQCNFAPPAVGLQDGKILDANGTLLHNFTVEGVTAPGTTPVTPPVTPPVHQVTVPGKLLQSGVCTQERCDFDVNIDKAGFFVAEVGLPAGNSEGFWGLSVSTTTNEPLGGGFHSGSALVENRRAAGFVAFYLAKEEEVDLIPYEYTGKISDFIIRLSSQDASGNRSVVYGPVTTQNAIKHPAGKLAPGFYVAEAYHDTAHRGYFGFSTLASSITGSVNVGGWIDGANGGFGAFYVPSSQTVKLSVLFNSSYRNSLNEVAGAGYLSLKLYEQDPATSGKQLYFDPETQQP